jgi:hypothetical protein
MNWKRIALYAGILLVVLRFRNQIVGAVSAIPFVGKVVG